MKLITRPILIALASVLLASCVTVTDGVTPARPATDREQAQANLALGVGYLQQQRPDLAIEALLRAIDFEPRMADAHSTIALAYDQTGDAELAEEHHRRATQLEPANPIAQNGFAVFLCRQNRWEDAEPYFRRAISNAGAGSPVNAMLNAGLCARGAGDLESAEEFFRAVLGIEIVNPAALRAMIDLSVRTENYVGGRAFWQRLEQSASVESQDLLFCYMIERELQAARAADECAARLRREFPQSAALSQLRRMESDGR